MDDKFENAEGDNGEALDFFMKGRGLGCGNCQNKCKTRKLSDRLRTAGLRPTQQRLELGELLFTGGDRHITADMLHEEAIRRHIPVSLATVYNTLQQFSKVGLLRRLATDTPKTWFDTNLSDHYHMVGEDDAIIDIPPGCVSISDLPELPEGMEVDHIDVVVRLRGRES